MSPTTMLPSFITTGESGWADSRSFQRRCPPGLRAKRVLSGPGQRMVPSDIRAGVVEVSLP